MLSERRIETGIAKAVRHFWDTRSGQAKKQQDAGRSDRGARGAVTGGKQMDGFINLVANRLVKDAGCPKQFIFVHQELGCHGFVLGESFQKRRDPDEPLSPC